MAIYPGSSVVIGRGVTLRPDGTYVVQAHERADRPARQPARPSEAAHLAVARVALRELADRRERDLVARRLLNQAGVIDD